MLLQNDWNGVEILKEQFCIQWKVRTDAEAVCKGLNFKRKFFVFSIIQTQTEEEVQQEVTVIEDSQNEVGTQGL